MTVHATVDALERIENGLRALLKRVYFPMRNAFDGMKGEELTKAIEAEQERMDDCIEGLLSGERNPY
jgi:hypothetical protein